MALTLGLLFVGIAILLIPPFLQMLHVDVRGGEVIVGILLAVVAPEVLDVSWFVFLAEIGLLVLMFEIGLDIDLQPIKDDPIPSLKYGVLSFLVPLIAGGVAAYLYTGRVLSATVIAIGLSSTALAVVIPSMDRLGVGDHLVKNAAMVSEMLGITLLMSFARAQEIGSSSLLFEAGSVIFFVFFAVFIVPRFLDQVKFLDEKTFINFETKFMLFILLIVSLVSEELGVHAATGAFLAGLFLSESTHKGLAIEERLKPIIELLVPVFFVHIGYLVTPSLLTTQNVLIASGLAATVYLSRFLAFKFLSSQLAVSYNPRHLSLFAPCMTITATAAEIGNTAGLLPSEVFTMLLLAGLILTTIGPLGARFFHKPRGQDSQ